MAPVPDCGTQHTEISVIDEWQLAVAELLWVLKRLAVDDPSPGRFVLTGSVEPATYDPTYPLTGRAGRLARHPPLRSSPSGSLRPRRVTIRRFRSAPPALTGSILAALLPQQTPLPTAVGNFAAAPAGSGTYTGTAVGTVSPSLSFQLTLPGQATTTTVAPVVTTVPATTPAAGLPATGSDGIATTTMIALGLLAVGATLFVVAQVRRRQAPTAA